MIACERCKATSGKPPVNGRHRCGNCGHSWEVARKPLPKLTDRSTVGDLVGALRARGAQLVGLVPHGDVGATVTVAAGPVSLTIDVLTNEGGWAPGVLAELDFVLEGLASRRSS